MDKRTSNVVDVSPVNSVTRYQIMPHMGDMSHVLYTRFTTCNVALTLIQ